MIVREPPQKPRRPYKRREPVLPQTHNLVYVVEICPFRDKFFLKIKFGKHFVMASRPAPSIKAAKILWLKFYDGINRHQFRTIFP